MNKYLLFLEKNFGAVLLRILSVTIKKKYFSKFYSEPVIYMIWHRDQILSILTNQNKNIGVIISKSKDGELIAGPVSKLGFVPLRGSSHRGGANALKRMLTHLKVSSVAITPDGPRGPIYSIKDGVLVAAYLSKRPIVPVICECNYEWIFHKSWDRFRVPKPFSKINIIYGNKIYVKDKSDFGKIRIALEKEMLRLHNKVKF